MKKIIMLSAVMAAVSTAFVACSSDDDLVSQTKGSEITDTKCPFNFVVSMNNGTYTRGEQGAEIVEANDMIEVTRATALTENPFETINNGFNLYGFNGTGMMWDTKAYTLTSGGWSGGGQWPGNDGACYFYALSNAGASFPDNPTSTNLKNHPSIPTVLNSNGYDEVSFVYELPLVEGKTYFDGTKQEDLLVAENMNGISSGDVALEFSHALANLEVKIALPGDGFDASNEQYSESFDERVNFSYFMYVKSITIHNLPVSGTYTFGNGWTESSSKGNIEISYPTGRIIYSKSFGAVATAKGADLSAFAADASVQRAFERKWCYEDVFSGDASMMLIPHTTTEWDVTGSLSPASDTYIEINGFIGYLGGRGANAINPLNDAEKEKIANAITAAQGSTGEWDVSEFDDPKVIPQFGDLDGLTDYMGASFYIQIPQTIFQANRKYTFYITVSGKNLRNDDGTIVIDGIS